MVEGVLGAFKKWASSAAVLHAAVECLREVLKLAGGLAAMAQVVEMQEGRCIGLLDGCYVLLHQRYALSA